MSLVCDFNTILIAKPCEVVDAMVQSSHLSGILLSLLSRELDSILFGLVKVLIGLHEFFNLL